MRTCIGCRRAAPQDELRRVVRRSDATLAVGRTLDGRGAWLCAGSAPCFDLASRRDAFRRAFRASVDRSAAEAIRDQFLAGVDQPGTDFVLGPAPARH